MTAVWNGFHSPLAPHIEQYLATKRAMGCKFASEDRMLRLLDRFLDEQGINRVEAVDSACLEAFMASRNRVNARSYNHLLGVVRRLFDWIVSQQILAASPLQAKARSETARRLPFLFPPAAIKELLVEAQALHDNARAPLRGATYEMVFALLAGLGLRVGEVARLQCGDVDLEREVLEIRDTKFGKDRLVPFGPKLAARLRRYLAQREAHGYLWVHLYQHQQHPQYVPGRPVATAVFGYSGRSFRSACSWATSLVCCPDTAEMVSPGDRACRTVAPSVNLSGPPQSSEHGRIPHHHQRTLRCRQSAV
jgi:site-specific recombinase XerD